jgi:cyanophycin synthetase
MTDTIDDTIHPPPAAPARIHVLPGGRVLMGSGYGLRQRVMLVDLRVELPAGCDLRELDETMRSRVGEPQPEALAAAFEGGAAALVRRALHWASAVQRSRKLPVFGDGVAWALRDRSEGGPTGQSFRAAIPCAHPDAAAAALSWTARRIAGLTAGKDDGAGPDFDALQALLARHGVGGVNMYRFLAAAHRLDIPWQPFAGGAYVFGSGRHARWLSSTFTDRTSAIGANLARDKAQAAAVLRRQGLPGPRHRLARSAAEAVAAAAQLGYPVVVKPADRDQGIGVAAGLRTPGAVEAAFAEAAGHSSRILVEKHFEGRDYRLTVFEGRVIKIAGRVAGGVVGDGLSTVAELVAASQGSEVMQRRARERGRQLLELDREALELLAEEGRSAASIPAPGEYLRLRRRSNISAGGQSVPVALGQAHPDNLRLAVRCAAALGLDLAGIDLIVEDIGQSWLQTGALVCEVNAQPQIGLGATPQVYEEILAAMVRGRGRIPVLLVVGEAPDAEEALRALAARMSGQDGPNLVCASRAGLRAGGQALSAAFDGGFGAGRAALSDREADAVAMAMTPEELLRSGLPSDRFELLVLAPAKPGPQWMPQPMGAFWRMVLPHVRSTVILRTGGGWAAHEPVAAGGPRWFRSVRPGACVDEACRLLSEAGAW